MAKRDISGAVAERATTILAAVRENLGRRLYAGPTSVKLSPKEALDRLNAMTPQERLDLVQSRGVDALLGSVQGLQVRASTKQRDNKIPY